MLSGRRSVVEEKEEVGRVNVRRVEEGEKAQRLRDWRGRVRKARKEEELKEVVALGKVRLNAEFFFFGGFWGFFWGF